MFFCFETLAIEDGVVQNLAYHQARYQRTLQYFYPDYQPFQLADIVKVPLQYRQGLVRCRVDYHQTGYQVAFFPYQRRPIKRFQPVIAERLAYRFKYCDRQALNLLYQQRQAADEILIIQQGKITDCSIGNLVFLRQGEWFTPNTPLLAGTQRQALLERQIIAERTIYLEQLDRFEEIRVINALNKLEP